MLDDIGKQNGCADPEPAGTVAPRSRYHCHVGGDAKEGPVSDIEPETTEVQTTYDPATRTTTEVRRTEVRSNAAAWWIAGIVAVVAIIAVVFMVTQPAPNSQPTTDQLTAAADQGRAQAAADSATAALSQAQTQAQSAQQNASANLSIEADRAARARADAEAAASRAAANANDAGRDASSTASDSNPAPQR